MTSLGAPLFVRRHRTGTSIISRDKSPGLLEHPRSIDFSSLAIPHRLRSIAQNGQLSALFHRRHVLQPISVPNATWRSVPPHHYPTHKSRVLTYHDTAPRQDLRLRRAGTSLHPPRSLLRPKQLVLTLPLHPNPHRVNLAFRASHRAPHPLRIPRVRKPLPRPLRLHALHHQTRNRSPPQTHQTRRDVLSLMRLRLPRARSHCQNHTRTRLRGKYSLVPFLGIEQMLGKFNDFWNTPNSRYVGHWKQFHDPYGRHGLILHCLTSVKITASERGACVIVSRCGPSMDIGA
jgi:hypothetical protein